MRVFVLLLGIAAWSAPYHEAVSQDLVETRPSVPNIPAPRKQWGIMAEVGVVEFDMRRLNTYFTAKTPAMLPRDGAQSSISVMFSNRVFDYVGVFYQRANTVAKQLISAPALSLQQTTFGFDFHKVLLDKRRVKVGPSLGMGYRVMNLTHEASPNVPTTLDSLFQQKGSFTIQALNLTADADVGIYYKTYWLQKLGVREFNWGLVGAYSYSFQQGEWFLFGTKSLVQVPRSRLDYYAIRLSANVFFDR